MRVLITAAAILALLTVDSDAQNKIPETLPLSEADRAEIAKRKADEIATDEAYKSTLKQLKGNDQKVDPWGGMRTPAPAGNK
jgi:hypothetical protein